MTEPDTREGWEEFFKKAYGAVGLKYVDLEHPDLNERWEMFVPDIPPAKKGAFKAEMMSMPMGSVKVNWVLHCLKCDRWFNNGWYQTECQCGNHIPGEFIYP